MAEARGAVGSERAVCFQGVRFEPGSQRLWRNDAEVALRPKTAAVLAHLVGRAGEVVSKQELLNAVWPEGFVGDVVLSVCVNELRRALGDDAHAPIFIATAHRRGYRLVAEVTLRPQAPKEVRQVFVGRGPELALLHDWWGQARRGEQRTCFVAASAGVGKTALVDSFVGRLRDADHPLLGQGQCIGRLSTGEPYLPVLQPLAELWRGPGGAAVPAARST